MSVADTISTYGYSKSDFMSGAIGWLDIVHRDDHGWLMQKHHVCEMEKIDQYAAIYRVVRKDGSISWVLDNTTITRDVDGDPAYFDCIISDYDAIKRNIARIEDGYRQQRVLNEILQGLRDSNPDNSFQIILNCAGSYLDISRVIVFEDDAEHKTSRAVYEWCNTDIPSILEEGEFRLNHASDIPKIAEGLAKTGRKIIDSEEIAQCRGAELERAGTLATAVYAISAGGERFGFICFDECKKERTWPEETVRFLDTIAELVSTALLRKQNAQIISDMALIDQLTGLNNRCALETRLNEALTNAKLAGQSGYVIFIDIDDFKIINDGYGHDYGDLILGKFASFLKEHFSSGAEIFRFGGDEFVILLFPDGSDAVHPIIDSIKARSRLPWPVMDKSFYCTLSIGVVRFPDASADSREIIKNADIAMYQAKKTGKNNHVFYARTQDNDAIARAEIEKAMREAIDAGFTGFETVFQPIVDLRDGIVGAEALLRWRLPDGTRLPPDKFIPLAEYLGLIVPLGEFVLRSTAAACRRIIELRPDFLMGVNTSIRQLQQQDYLEQTLRILRLVGMANANLVIEITEGLAMQDIRRMRIICEEFRKNGVTIAMDDFGSGHSSLGNMRELPLDIVKIDRAFVNDIVRDGYSKSFIRLITDLVHSLGKKVCAEGIETPAQLRYCRECGVDYFQGFHLFKPMPAAELLASVANPDPGRRAHVPESPAVRGPLRAGETGKGGGARFFARPTRRFARQAGEVDDNGKDASCATRRQ